MADDKEKKEKSNVDTKEWILEEDSSLSYRMYTNIIENIILIIVIIFILTFLVIAICGYFEIKIGNEIDNIFISSIGSFFLFCGVNVVIDNVFLPKEKEMKCTMPIKVIIYDVEMHYRRHGRAYVPIFQYTYKGKTYIVKGKTRVGNKNLYIKGNEQEIFINSNMPMEILYWKEPIKYRVINTIIGSIMYILGFIVTISMIIAVFS